MKNLLALPVGTELVGDYRIERVLGAGGFGITYLAFEKPLARRVTIKEYFPSDFAARDGDISVQPRSRECAEDYKWGLDRFIEEAQTLAKFEHPHIVRVYRYFRANSTGYMVLKFEEGQSFKAWLKGLGRAPRQAELDAIVAPLLDALDTLHRGDCLHRDIAPDNIMIRKGGEPVLIDFGSARGEIAAHSRTVSALVKPGYSPYEQYATRSSQQGPWTDIYALAATLYQATTGKRPPDAPSRVVSDDLVPTRDAALSSYRAGFLAAIDKALAVEPKDRPQSVAAWRGLLLAPEERKPRLGLGRLGRQAGAEAEPPLSPAKPGGSAATVVPPPPDAPQPQGHLLDFIDGLRGRPKAAAVAVAGVANGPDAARAAVPVAAGPAEGRPADEAKPVISRSRRGTPGPVGPPAPLDGGRGGPAEAGLPRAARLPARPRGAGLDLRRRMRPLAWKLLIGVGVASAAVAFQDQLPRVEVRGFGQVSSQSGESGEVLKLTGHKGAVLAAGFGDEGRSLVSLGVDGTLRLWSPVTGALLRTMTLASQDATSLAVAGGRVAVGLGNGEAQIWDLGRGERIGAFKRNAAPVAGVGLLSEPARIAVATHDRGLALWDEDKPAMPRRVLEAHAGAILALAVSADQRLLLTGGADRTMRLWSSEGPSLIRTYRGHRDPVAAVAIAPGGRHLAGGAHDGTVRVWSAASARFERTLQGSAGRVAALAFAPGRTALAVAGDDGVVRLWDHVSGRLLRAYRGHAGPVRSVAFAPDGLRLASSGDDGTIRLWDVDAGAAERSR